MSEPRQTLRVGIDVGGTFTDGVLVDTNRDLVFTSKVRTVPENPADAIVEALRLLIDAAGVPIASIDELVHGTTLVTNSLIERKGARVGLITTKGHRDTLELGREYRYDIYDLDIDRQAPLAPRDLRLGVTERTRYDGTIDTPIDLDEVRRGAEHLGHAGVTAVAVAFLHSYLNPTHEQAALDLIQREFPDLDVSVSHQIAPEIREFDRTSTVVANSFVRARVRHYIGDLMQRLKAEGLRCDLKVLLSDGGMSSVDIALEKPISLLESGPAGGVVSAAFHAAEAGRQDVIAFDMGGTTAKMALVEDGAPSVVRETEVARLHRFRRGSGMPLKVSTVELLEVGAGGGSIAWIDQLGLLKVGPTSAGAEPGPACYGRGGTLPTVSDADLLLGYLDAEGFLGGRMPLDTTAAIAAFQNHLCDALGLTPEQAAAGVHRVVNEYMARAMRTHIVERGQDPRKYAIVATGGAGPVHAYGVARTLGVQSILIPPRPSTASAFGFLVSPMTFHDQRSLMIELAEGALPILTDALTELEETATHRLRDLLPAEVNFDWMLDMRFLGQGHEVSVAVPRSQPDHGWLDQVHELFRARYTTLYGHVPSEKLPIEVVTVRTKAYGPTPKLARALDFGYGTTAAGSRRRHTYFPELDKFVSCLVVRREELSPNVVVAGPVLIEEDDTTIVVGPGATVLRNDQECLEISLPSTVAPEEDPGIGISHAS